jgi:type II secretory pathway component PulF
MKTILDSFGQSRAASKFKKTRDQFYRDLAEAFEASENLSTFFQRRVTFCEEQGYVRLAALYIEIDLRLEENSELSYVLAGLVPDTDMLSLASVDSAPDDREKAKRLRTLAVTVRRLSEMNKLVTKAVQSPLIALPVVIGLPVVVATQFMPAYAELIPPAEWNLWGKLLYWVSYAIREGWFVLVALAVSSLWWLVRSFRRWTGSRRARFDNHLPYSLYRDAVSASFLRALAQKMVDKTPLVVALTELQGQASPWLAWRIQQALDRLDEVPDDYAGAFRSGLLAPDVHLRLVTYAERGNSRVSGANDAFAAGIVQLGTDGLDYVFERVEANAVWIGVASTAATVATVIFFYGGNVSVGNMISEKMKAQSEFTENQARSSPR